MGKVDSSAILRRKISIRIKFFLTILTASFLVSLAALYFAYTSIHEALFQGLRSELTATAKTAAASIDGDKHKLLELSGDENSPYYRELKEQLKAIRDSNPKIRYVYTMAKTNKPNIWEFIVDAEENPELMSHLGEPFDTSKCNEMKRAFDNPTADKSLTTDKWGTWLSGYAPIYDISGQAVAIVGVDMSADHVRASIAERQRELLPPLSMLLIIPAVISLLISRRASKLLAEIIEATKKIADGNYDQRVSVKTNDEIGELAGALNAMAVNIGERVGSAEEMATIDGLTDIYNHRYFQERLSGEIKRAERYNRELTLMIIDIDNFTRFNTVNGHNLGDVALKQIAGLIKQTVRDTDIVARYAGEEFAVIFPETSEEKALLMGERISIIISTHRFDTKHNIAIPITVGIGIASYPKCGTRSQELIESAYEALKEAKQLGNGQIVMYDKPGKQTKVKPLKENAETDDMLLSAVFSLAKAVDARDRYTRRHSEFVARYSAALGKSIGLGERDVTNISIAGLLHDVGKIGVPDSVLNKRGTLTDAEWTYIDRHPVLGADIVRHLKGLSNIVKIILHHHERFDGTGYPDRMKGEEIPLMARILAVVDSYHAMISSRPYRKGLSHDEAISELMRCRGTQFDPNLVDKFVELLENENRPAEDSFTDTDSPEATSA